MRNKKKRHRLVEMPPLASIYHLCCIVHILAQREWKKHSFWKTECLIFKVQTFNTLNKSDLIFACIFQCVTAFRMCHTCMVIFLPASLPAQCIVMKSYNAFQSWIIIIKVYFIYHCCISYCLHDVNSSLWVRLRLKLWFRIRIR